MARIIFAAALLGISQAVSQYRYNSLPPIQYWPSTPPAARAPPTLRAPTPKASPPPVLKSEEKEKEDRKKKLKNMVKELDEIKEKIESFDITQELVAEQLGALKGNIDAQYSITRPL